MHEASADIYLASLEVFRKDPTTKSITTLKNNMRNSLFRESSWSTDTRNASPDDDNLVNLLHKDTV